MSVCAGVPNAKSARSSSEPAAPNSSTSDGWLPISSSRPIALEDERGAGVEAVRLAPEGRVAVETLRREADADILLRRPAAEAPQSAGLTGETVVVLAGRALPVLGAVPPPHLDVATGRVHRGDPVEAVAPHVHEAAAAVEIRRQPVEHLDRVVLGMRPRHDDPL